MRNLWFLAKIMVARRVLVWFLAMQAWAYKGGDPMDEATRRKREHAIRIVALADRLLSALTPR